MTLFIDVAKILKDKGMDEVLIIGGGIIPDQDIPKLKKEGISAIFGPGTPCKEIVEYINKNVKR